MAETMREKIGSAIAYSGAMDSLPIRTTMRCGGTVWLYMRNGKTYQITVTEVENADRKG